MTEPDVTPPVRTLWLRLAVVVSVLGIAATAFFAFSVQRGSSRVQVLEEAIARHAHDYGAQRWERPVLRGEPLAGEAFSAQEEAVDTLAEVIPAEPFDGFNQSLEAGGPWHPDLAPLVGKLAPYLDQVQSSARRTYVQHSVDLGSSMAPEPVTSLASLVRVYRLLLVRAAGRGGGACLQDGADVIRLGQDFAAATGLLGTAVWGMASCAAATVMARCALATTAQARAAALAEVSMLHEHPPPLGRVYEVETLLLATMLRMEAVGTPEYPAVRVPTSVAEVERWWQGRIALELWERLPEPRQWRDLDARDYAAAFERAEAQTAAWARSDNGLASVSAEMWQMPIRRHAHAQACTRSLLVALHEGDGTGTGAPSAIEASDARDPFRDGPLSWRRDTLGLSLWSVGPNGRDDGATGDDIVLRVRVPTPAGDTER